MAKRKLKDIIGAWGSNVDVEKKVNADHEVQEIDDRNGNGDDVFKGTTKTNQPHKGKKPVIKESGDYPEAAINPSSGRASSSVNQTHFLRGFAVINHSGKVHSTHSDKRAAIRAADRAEDATGRIHTVHEVSRHPKGGYRVHNTWQYSDSQGGWARWKDNHLAKDKDYRIHIHEHSGIAKVNMKQGKPVGANDHGILAVAKALNKELGGTRLRYRGPRNTRAFGIPAGDTKKRSATGAVIYTNQKRRIPPNAPFEEAYEGKVRKSYQTIGRINIKDGKPKDEWDRVALDQARLDHGKIRLRYRGPRVKANDDTRGPHAKQSTALKKFATGAGIYRR